jgi:hypothetical protein
VVIVFDLIIAATKKVIAQEPSDIPHQHYLISVERRQSMKTKSGLFTKKNPDLKLFFYYWPIG